MDQGTHSLIKRHNEQMRDLIVRDIDALEDKLNVKRQVSSMADGAVDKVKGTLGMNNRNSSEGWADFVRHNAAPLLAVGLGGTVLARNVKDRVSTSDTTTTSTTVVTPGYAAYSTEETFDPTVGDTSSGDTGTGVKDKVGEKAANAKDTVTSSASSAKEAVTGRASSAKETVASTASNAKETVATSASGAKETVTTQAAHAKDVVVERIPSRDEAKRMAHEHNQLLGVAALAAGALAGAFTPRTKAEERKLAPMQSQVKEKAGDLVDSSVDKAKETADRAAEALGAAAETAKEEFSDSGDSEPPSGGADSSMPDLTRPNRITGARSTAPTGGVGY